MLDLLILTCRLDVPEIWLKNVHCVNAWGALPYEAIRDVFQGIIFHPKFLNGI